nr:MAG TPA: hypothetical protein [Caudoviricetes sp.]
MTIATSSYLVAIRRLSRLLQVADESYWQGVLYSYCSILFFLYCASNDALREL